MEVSQLDHLSGTEVTGDAEETSVPDSDSGTCGNAEVDSFQEDSQSSDSRIPQGEVSLEDTGDSADELEPLVPNYPHPVVWDVHGNKGIYIQIMYITLASLYQTWIERKLLS